MPSVLSTLCLAAAVLVGGVTELERVGALDADNLLPAHSKFGTAQSSDLCNRNPWNCNCWDCAAHSNAVNALEVSRAERSAWLQGWTRQAQDRTRTVVDGARVSWGIDGLRAAVVRLEGDIKGRSIADAKARGTARGKERASEVLERAQTRLNAAQV